MWSASSSLCCVVCRVGLSWCDDRSSGDEDEDMLLQSDGEVGSLQLQRRRKRTVSGAAGWLLQRVWRAVLVYPGSACERAGLQEAVFAVCSITLA
jgi:hypothetical protein